jgi:TRAP-type C4-dicarboxylate transport system permease small subunit
MDRFLRGYWRVLTAIGAVERVVGVSLIATIVLAITLQVGTRYFLGKPLVWVEELATYAFLWSVFIGAALGLKELRHIRIETFVGHLAPRSRALVRAALWMLVVFASVTIAVQAGDIMEIESRSRTMALPIELPRHLFYSVPLFTGVVSMALTGGYFVLAELARATVDRPVEAEAEAEAEAARRGHHDESASV